MIKMDERRINNPTQSDLTRGMLFPKTPTLPDPAERVDTERMGLADFDDEDEPSEAAFALPAPAPAVLQKQPEPDPEALKRPINIINKRPERPVFKSMENSSSSSGEGVGAVHQVIPTIRARKGVVSEGVGTETNQQGVGGVVTKSQLTFDKTVENQKDKVDVVKRGEGRKPGIQFAAIILSVFFKSQIFLL